MSACGFLIYAMPRAGARIIFKIVENKMRCSPSRDQMEQEIPFRRPYAHSKRDFLLHLGLKIVATPHRQCASNRVPVNEKGPSGKEGPLGVLEAKPGFRARLRRPHSPRRVPRLARCAGKRSAFPQLRAANAVRIRVPVNEKGPSSRKAPRAVWRRSPDSNRG